MRISDLKTKIFADGADFDGILELAANPVIKGFTTNPTLMRKSGVVDYAAFARKLLDALDERPISFEVFADDFDAMVEQGLEIASWGPNVNVKIPVTDTKGNFAGPVVERLSGEGCIVNVTALMTVDQVRNVAAALSPETPAFVSVFAGRAADTGVDPLPLMRDCLSVLESRPKAELIWASPRELLNVFQADEIGCHVITVTHDILKKLSLVGKDLTDYSLETVQMFHRDAVDAGFSIEPSGTARRGVA